MPQGRVGKAVPRAGSRCSAKGEFTGEGKLARANGVFANVRTRRATADGAGLPAVGRLGENRSLTPEAWNLTP